MRLALGSIVTVLALSGCAPVGPKYEPPKTATPAAYKEQPPGAELMQPAQPSDGARRPAWWEAFGDARLNELEAKLQASNPTIAQAESTTTMTMEPRARLTLLLLPASADAGARTAGAADP